MQTASTPAVATPTTLTIVVDSEVEKEQLQEYIAMADQYSLSKHEEADQYYATKKEEADALANRIYFLAGEEFNINSPKQLGELLFDKLGLPVQKKTKSDV